MVTGKTCLNCILKEIKIALGKFRELLLRQRGPNTKKDFEISLKSPSRAGAGLSARNSKSVLYLIFLFLFFK